MMNDVISLVSVTYTSDSIGQHIPTETTKEVFCRIDSVTASEFFEAGRSGLKAQYRATILDSEYSGEEVVVYGGVRYGIYRTYKPGADTIELYLEKKVGA